MIVGVLVEITNKNVDRIFDYIVPDHLQSKIKVGVRVLVSFGSRVVEGFVLEVKKEKSQMELKEIESVIDDDIVLNSELIDIGKWLHTQTISSLISCFQVMLPKALKAKNGKSISIKYDTYYELVSCDAFFKGKQKEIVDSLIKNGQVLRRDLLEISSSALNTLVKKGVVREVLKEHYRVEYQEVSIQKKELTFLQKEAVSSVVNRGEGVYLLHGVTGSGKTEVYMEMIDFYLQQGKTCIVLVPEISLTPQMVGRFRERFGNKIAALHSALSDGEKYDEWRRIYRGEASIVIGARSAIFAPLNNVGIIIIDEEHSDSYKQSDPNPRYHARDIAIYRGKTHHCPVVLGSATPSLESMARALKDVYHYISLPERVNGKSLPEVKIIDMNQAMKKSTGHFSLELIHEIEKRLELKEQVILLLNRRGYSSFVTCKNCGYTFKCPNCDISLTYHKSSNTLRCHYCGFGEKVYRKCPECGEESLNNLGVGTQRIEEELLELFPASKVLRMDYDTTSRKGMHEEMIQSFKNHEYDILLGTQMVAKGLDFSLVTLVGVINADTSLNIPDFRSSENTFSLLSQVAGRSGRSERNGFVLIQTFNPDHYAIEFARKHDYLGFYHQEMFIRKEMKYPPYYYLCNIRISGKDASYIFDEALKIKKYLEQELNSIIVLGPSSSTVFRVNNIFHYHIILKYKDVTPLYSHLEKVIQHYVSNQKIKIDIDFNPSQML